MKGWHGEGRLRRNEFKIWPYGMSRPYVEVVVWDLARALREFGSLVSPAIRGRRIVGFCTIPTVRGRRIATVHLCRRYLGAGTVSHEMLHAAVAWGARHGWNWGELASLEGLIPKDATEERLANTLDQLVRGFYTHAYAHGIIISKGT